MVRQGPRLYRHLNTLTVLLAVLVVAGGFWKVFIAPVRGARQRERQVAAQRHLSQEEELKCGELLETYQSAAYAAMHIQRGEGRVGRRLEFMDEIRAKMRRMGCPNAP